MSNTTHTRISKDLYEKLRQFSFVKHSSLKGVKTELDEAVKRYLAQEVPQTNRRKNKCP